MKTYCVKRCADFDLDQAEEAVKIAQTAELYDNDGRSTTPYQTKFRLLRGPEFLYFWFFCEDDQPKSKLTAYNAPLYNEEVVELFFCNTADPNRYYELEINHLNAVFCAQIDYMQEKSANVIHLIEQNPLCTKVKTAESGWEVYGKIPLALFKHSAEEWTFNAYRIKRDENDHMILSAFSPTLRPNFHTPSQFARLIFER